MSTQAINWRETPFTDRERLLLAIIGVLLLVIGGLFVFGDGYGILRTSERHSYVTNLFTEGISVVVTVVALGLWQAGRAREDLKATLVRRVKSRSNDIVIGAIEELRYYGWLTGDDGLLQGEKLHKAQMQEADLRDAKLEGAILWYANLTGAELRAANLTGAILRGANLTGAILRKANVTRAKLEGANLTGADLRRANLEEADLGLANLTGANLLGAKLEGAVLWGANLQKAGLGSANLTGADLHNANLTDAILPNRETYSDTTDMGKFTDKDHPKYAQTRGQINVLRREVGLPPLA